MKLWNVPSGAHHPSYLQLGARWLYTRRPHGLRTRMYVHRAAYVALSLAVCGLIYGGAYWLYSYNLDNTRTIGNFFETYRVRYDYNRYIGESRPDAVRDAMFTDRVSAAPMPAGYATSVPVLLYHRVATDKDVYNVTPGDFKHQMFALKKAGYTTVSADDYANFIAGKKRLPAKSVFITFDDGTKDSYYPVDPVLSALGFRATEFVITKYNIEDFAGSHYYLSAIELHAMQRSGHWDLEPHTDIGHSYYAISSNGTKGEFYPNKLWLSASHRMETDAEYAARVYNDMATAKREVEQFTGKPATLFAFPFADIGENDSSNYHNAPNVLTAATKRLFKAAMMLYYPGRDRSQEYYNSNQFYAYRIQLTQGLWSNGQGLVAFLGQGDAKPLPYNDRLATNSGWEYAWGKGDVQNGTLTIGSSGTDKTGAGAVLDGSSGWSDYTMTARVTLNQGSSYGLLARLQGADYRIGCYFGANYFSVTRSMGSAFTTLQESDLDGLAVNQPQTVGVRMHGHTIQCLLNGEVLTEVTDPAMPPSGGIGFSVYDATHPSSLTIQDISVVAS